ncbi:CHAT domain-containing protein [Pseudonocardia lacus]|uniref:CHAT domain-containing protein n=1 Tax=Pseudonocardia lacus TaxID=2835865 RepID=UPI001BDC911D|nr:CHAT domain-containing protein [Pseudonocardia lacus]
MRSLPVGGAAAPAGPAGTVLVAGPDLAGARREVDELAALFPGATVLAPPRSTVPAVIAALSGADLAHLGCHGLLRVDNPTFSALRLCGGDLTLHALDQLGAAPRRVVLAACDSANGFVYDGNEVLGFVSALMARGSTAVAANSAPVGDPESVPLTTGVHRALRDGAAMAEAVHTGRAVLDREDPRQFVSWCVTTAFGGG